MKILVVDDNHTNILMLTKMLSHLGYDSVHENNGHSAIEAVKNDHIDIILMDIMMPGLDGYETTGIIKDICGQNHIPIIFTTALKGETALKKSLESGGDDYIEKPISIDILESKLRAHTRIRELTQQLISNNLALESHNKRLKYEHELISYFFDNALKRSYLDKRYIRYHTSPAAAFNGDLMLSARSPSGGLYVMLGDFTGHGLTAAMGTLPVAQQFFELTKSALYIGDIAKRINITLKQLLPEELFFAATIVELTSDGRQLEIWNGGMPDSVITTQLGTSFKAIPSQHMPLGILEDHEFDPTTVQHTIEPSERLILYTDGIIEAKNPQSEEFGEHRLHALFNESGNALFQKIKQQLSSHCGITDQQDDISIIEIFCGNISNHTQIDTCTDKSRQPWSFSTTISNEAICNTNPIAHIVDIIDAAINLRDHKGIIHTILSEIYNNALDHSILGIENTDDDLVLYYQMREKAIKQLKDAFMKLQVNYSLEKDTGALSISLVNGGGNSSTSSSYKPDLEQNKQNNSSHGRGLHILSELCSSIDIDHAQKRIELTYTL